VFLAATALISRNGGFPAIAASSVICTALFSYTFGIWRTKTEFRLSWSEVAGRWLAPAAKVALILGPLAALLWLGTLELRPLPALALRLGILGTAGAWALLRWGLGRELQAEILRRVPPAWHGMLRFGI